MWFLILYIMSKNISWFGSMLCWWRLFSFYKKFVVFLPVFFWFLFSFFFVEKRDELLEKYYSASNEERELLYKQYGGRRIFEKFIEDQESAKFIKESTKPCPNCGANIQVYFCWLFFIVAHNFHSEKVISINFIFSFYFIFR